LCEGACCWETEALNRRSHCAFDVCVDPLAVFGDVGEVVDALLVDLFPAADTQFLADEGDGVVD
jgi:hypothetical protein